MQARGTLSSVGRTARTSAISPASERECGMRLASDGRWLCHCVQSYVVHRQMYVSPVQITYISKFSPDLVRKERDNGNFLQRRDERAVFHNGSRVTSSSQPRAPLSHANMEQLDHPCAVQGQRGAQLRRRGGEEVGQTATPLLLCDMSVLSCSWCG